MRTVIHQAALWVALLAGIAGCAAPQEAGSAATTLAAEPSAVADDPGGVLVNDDSAPGPTETSVVEVDIMLELGAKFGAETYRGDERRIELPPNATRGRVTTTWEPTVATAERLVIQVLDGPLIQEGTVVMEAEGASPLEFDVPVDGIRYWHFIAKAAQYQVALNQPIHVRAEIDHASSPAQSP